MYHHVAVHPAAGPYGLALTVTPVEFASQLQWLQRHGCAAVTVDQLVNDVRAGALRTCEVGLTFDDGYADDFTEVAPILQRYGDLATFFVTSGAVGTSGHLSAAQVRALAAGGMEIGAHTVTHADLTTLGSGALNREVRDSRAALQRISGQPVDAFAYPAGRFDRGVESAVHDAGFNEAFSTDPGTVDAAAIARDPYALPRLRILRGSGETLMASVLAGARGASASLPQAALRGIARRRIEGNAPEVAERVGVALLRGEFPEPILKVRVLKAGPAVVAGIMLSGVKFHEPVDRKAFASDVSSMTSRAFAADASISEVDVWAVVPIAVAPNADVSGDLAIPTNRTVFAASMLRADWLRDRAPADAQYWAPGWQPGSN